ncbi:MAG: DUF302 domain-containing protein [Candidatus Thermoplasmatota archaeon]|nr:DUF302 domain-containing protein [Candidatus Thermoplasmatota archaeon]MBS3790444.1 DUF302 domain-containing protein [Candidatus Thermoplasmatota archaeon]
MSLKIDPSIFEAEDLGEKSVTLNMEHEEAVEYVREICERHGFGIPVEFSPSDLLNEKVGSDRDPYYVLGACNPRVADKALDQTMKLGGLFPCNMVIWEEEPGIQQVYHLSIMRVARLIGIAPDNDEWEDIVDETGKIVEAVFNELES